jgi:RHS repeat-associated protein
LVQTRDTDGQGTTESSRISNRYLYGDAVDQVLADELYVTTIPGPITTQATTTVAAPVASTTAGSILWTVGDHLGSIRDLVDILGTTRQHVVYDSFGKRLTEVDRNTAGTVISSTNALALDTVFGYTGREWDKETGLQNNRARPYDPATGRFISQDPIGFGGGDANLYRYVGNGPTNATDPSGLEAILVIYVETIGMPRNVDLDQVGDNMEQILQAAGSSARIVLIPTSRDVHHSERGWHDDDTSYFWASGWWNYYPVTWVTSGIHDCYVEIKDGLTDNERWYVHEVRFEQTKSAGYIANTPGTYTVVNLTGLNQAAAGQGTVDWDILFANLLMHEVFYLGLLGNVDNPTAAAGAFGSASANVRVLMTLTPQEQEAIDEALNCE